MSSTTRCRNDCYQINLHLTLSEEDSCFFDRYGPSLFNIRKCGHKKDCTCCAAPESSSASSRPGVAVKFPDAVILNIDIDRCDCTKASFNIYVKLPCKPVNTQDVQCAVNALEEEFNECSRDCLTASPGSATVNFGTPIVAGTFILNNIPVLINNVNELLSNCDNTITELLALIDAALTLISQLLTAIDTYNGTCDLTRLRSRLTVLRDALGELSDKLLAPTGLFLNQTFCITSGSSGHEREIITFDVTPLPRNVVSSGVFTKCYSYEVTRVPCRVVDEDGLEFCRRKTGIDFVLDPNECCTLCNVPNLYYVPDTLRIMFPMTKDIKCLVPDFSLSGTFVNAAFGTIATKVRLVSCTPCKFFLPAKLTFDKAKCMVCLDISAAYIMSNASRHDMEGYEHRFGCECGTKCFNKCPCDVTDLRTALLSIQQTFVNSSCSIDKDSPRDIALWNALGNVTFQTLARSKKIDVMGVNKCAETTLFSFQVCYVPYRGFCIDLCGCKSKTDVPDFGTVEIGTEPTVTYTLTPCNSFKVQADCEYSYEFLKLSSGYIDPHCP